MHDSIGATEINHPQPSAGKGIPENDRMRKLQENDKMESWQVTLLCTAYLFRCSILYNEEINQISEWDQIQLIDKAAAKGENK